MTPDFSSASWRKSTRSSSSGGACVEVAFVAAHDSWRKSSHSQGNGGACIEVAFASSDAAWQKSSHSGSNGGQCVEVAVQPSVVGLRDSKESDGPILAVGRGTFDSFLRAIKSGRV